MSQGTLPAQEWDPAFQKFLEEINAVEGQEHWRKPLFAQTRSLLEELRGHVEPMWEARKWRGHETKDEFKRRYLPTVAIDDSGRSAEEILSTPMSEVEGDHPGRFFRFSFADSEKAAETALLIVGGNRQTPDPSRETNFMIRNYAEAIGAARKGRASLDVGYAATGSIPSSFVDAKSHPLIAFEHLKTLLPHFIRGQKTLVIDAYSMGAGAVTKLFNEKDKYGATAMDFLKNSGVQRVFVILRDPMAFPPSRLPAQPLQEPPNPESLNGIPMYVYTFYQKDESLQKIDFAGEVPYESNSPFSRVFRFADPGDTVSHRDLDMTPKTPYEAIWGKKFRPEEDIEEQFGLKKDEVEEMRGVTVVPAGA